MEDVEREEVEPRTPMALKKVSVSIKTKLGCYRQDHRSLEFSHMADHNYQSDHSKAIGVTMITETSAVAFRQNLGEMLNQVQYRHDSVLINKDGKPVAALIDTRLFDRIRRLQDRFDALCHRVESGYESVSEEIGLTEIDAAVEAERASAHITSK